jgi:hypothetical protein
MFVQLVSLTENAMTYYKLGQQHMAVLEAKIFMFEV